MRLVTNIVTITIILIALSFLLLSIFVNQYTVYDKSSYEETPEFPILSTLSESQLLEKMSYGDIARDVKGNLISQGKGTEGALCPNCTRQ
jgi:hypothetical protein